MPFLGSSHPSNSSTSEKQRAIRVQFLSAQEQKLLAVLSLRVQPQPHLVDQTFRFWHPEQTFMKKSIRLPPAAGTLPGIPIGTAGVQRVQLIARSSDQNVLVETRPTPPGEPQDVFVKVACGAAPQVKRFFVAVYTDSFTAKPAQVWQFYVHSMQRVDVACSEGQSSQFSLILRGTQAARLVKSFSSHPAELVASPTEQYLLAPAAAHELQVAVKSVKSGNRFMLLNVVDAEYKQMVRSWLVCVACRPPVISKAFTVNVPVGGGKETNKRVSFTNPYSITKKFRLSTSRADLLQFKEEELNLGAGQTGELALRFVPMSIPTAADVTVFINNEEEKTEEAFCIRLKYA